MDVFGEGLAGDHVVAAVWGEGALDSGEVTFLAVFLQVTEAACRSCIWFSLIVSTAPFTCRIFYYYYGPVSTSITSFNSSSAGSAL